MKGITLLLACAIPLCLPGPATADVVHRRGARALTGAVEDRGDVLVVHTTGKQGAVAVPRDQVLFVERTGGPVGHSPTRRDRQAEIRSLLRKVGSSNLQERLEAHHALQAVDPGELYRPLVRGLNSTRLGVRHFSAFELGELGSQEALGDLVRTALHDRDEGVRDAAFAAAMKIGHPRLYTTFVRALFDRSEAVRVRAARFLGALGDPRAVEYLVTRYAIAGGSGARASLSVLDEQAYVRDFDVEVAQAAAIADPIIGILRPGATLDVKVIGIYGTLTTIERRVIGDALRDLTGREMGDVPGAWVGWWNRNHPERHKGPRGRVPR